MPSTHFLWIGSETLPRCTNPRQKRRAHERSRYNGPNARYDPLWKPQRMILLPSAHDVAHVYQSKISIVFSSLALRTCCCLRLASRALFKDAGISRQRCVSERHGRPKDGKADDVLGFSPGPNLLFLLMCVTLGVTGPSSWQESVESVSSDESQSNSSPAKKAYASCASSVGSSTGSSTSAPACHNQEPNIANACRMDS